MREFKDSVTGKDDDREELPTTDSEASEPSEDEPKPAAAGQKQS
jgi:hypothetical protein